MSSYSSEKPDYGIRDGRADGCVIQNSILDERHSKFEKKICISVHLVIEFPNAG